MKRNTNKKKFSLFHNTRCSKSRSCLKILQDKDVSFKEVNYLKTGLTLNVLEDIINNLASPLSEIIRTNEKVFKQNKFDINNKNLVISFLNKYPICLQRPIFFNGVRYIVCRPPEMILNFL
tara:strand:- start:2465 stop:2827 length:363 start_codon:yes stop_codon:yes gene_type:complete